MTTQRKKLLLAALTCLMFTVSGASHSCDYTGELCDNDTGVCKCVYDAATLEYNCSCEDS